MTAQTGDKIHYKELLLTMAASPLNQYLYWEKGIQFSMTRTDCMRGYFAEWNISNCNLHLTKLHVTSDPNFNLQTLFPKEETVFANWFSGDIRIPLGNPIKYVHLGYSSIHQKDLILTFENGVLIKEEMINNGNPHGNDP